MPVTADEEKGEAEAIVIHGPCRLRRGGLRLIRRNLVTQVGL